MDSSLLDLAYSKAAAHYKEATLAVFNDLRAANPKGDFDVIYRASVRAMELHFSSLKLAERVWAQSLSYEKAEESLIAQFQEFPQAVSQRAFGAAYSATR